MREPISTEECVYFTKRNDKEGAVKMWVFREKCPSCSKGIMGKPRDSKTGKPKIRATEYVCPDCNYTAEKEEYEDTLTANIKYECQCGNKGELETPFKRKRIIRLNEETQKKQAVNAIVFECSKCKHQFLVTKKMK